MWKNYDFIIEHFKELKFEADQEEKQPGGGSPSSLMITHQIYKMCPDCVLANMWNYKGTTDEMETSGGNIG